MGLHSATTSRLQLLREMVKSLSFGDEIKMDEFRKKLVAQNDAPPARFMRLLEQLRDLYNQQDLDGRPIRVLANGSIQLAQATVMQFEERLGKNREEKSVISSALLHWLFDTDSNGPACMTADSSNHPVLIEECGRNFPIKRGIKLRFNWARKDAESQSVIDRMLHRKREALRNRTVLSMLVDAGSSTYTFVNSFIGAEEFPLRVAPKKTNQEDAGGISSTYYRRIEPSILTNSIAIAERIGSPTARFRRNMTLRVIGGTERPERRSLSGEHALMWTRMLKSVGGVDLAVVGTTGIKQKQNADWALYMDDSVECELKSEFLEMAGFRIIICDASKILNGSCLNEFAFVNNHHIDLVVVNDPFNGEGFRNCDDEIEMEDRKIFEDFLRLAKLHNVGVISTWMA